MDKSKINYQSLALVYDRMMNQDNYLVWQKLISEVVDKYNIDKNKALDLACGTGNISKVLFDLGFSVVGVDQSAEMLKAAKDKCPEAEFVQADLRNFKIEHPDQIGLAVSFYDSLNYFLTDDDLKTVFENIYNNISDQAIFLFDLNPLEKIKVAQQFKDQVYEDDDFKVINKYGGQDKLWTIDMEIIDKKRGNFSTSEHHVERGYTQEEIIAFLKQASFSLLELRQQAGKDNDGKSYLSRLYFVARKR